MRWTPGGTSGDIEDDRSSSGGGGGGFGGMHIGIGGLLVLLVLSFIFKRDLITPFLNGGAVGGGTEGSAIRFVRAGRRAKHLDPDPAAIPARKIGFVPQRREFSVRVGA